jgi:nucleoside-diphosphate-sugar epimerase
VHKKKILVTGATGFVGTALCRRLTHDGVLHAGAVRQHAGFGQFEIGELTGRVDWSSALADCDAIIHLAARVHIMKDRADDPLTAFRAVNVAATENLARQAAQHGVRRFIFASSIKVNGESTSDKPFLASDLPITLDPYGQSKLEAEQALARIAEATGLEVVIVRPPLVYGPGVGANFLRLMQLVKSGLPLPFGALNNCRSMVALDNLIDLLLTCVRHPAAAGQTFLVSDGHDVSTPELIRMLAAAMGKRAWLLPVPTKLLAAGAAVAGKSAAAERLLGSLQVDIEKTRSTLGWQSVVSMDDAINATVAHFLSHS